MNNASAPQRRRNTVIVVGIAILCASIGLQLIRDADVDWSLVGAWALTVAMLGALILIGFGVVRAVMWLRSHPM